MLKPVRVSPIIKEEPKIMIAAKMCECGEAFNPTSNNQRRCPKCIEAHTAKSVETPIKALDRLDKNKSIRVLAEQLLEMAGSDKLEIFYSDFKVAIVKNQ
jgi:hypothetical protein